MTCDVCGRPVEGKRLMTEYDRIRSFIDEQHIVDAIPKMENQLEKTIGYSQRVGELINLAEHDYRLDYAERLSELKDLEEETETTRRAKLEAWTAAKKKTWQDLRTLYATLRSIKMSLAQAIKTRRSEMDMR